MRAGVAGLVRRVCVWGRREGDSGEAGHSHCVATEKDQSVKRSEKKKRKKIEKIIFFLVFFLFVFSVVRDSRDGGSDGNLVQHA
jgi:predicted nucleic acid-binding Zn ribbon protein